MSGSLIWIFFIIVLTGSVYVCIDVWKRVRWAKEDSGGYKFYLFILSLFYLYFFLYGWLALFSDSYFEFVL